MNTFAETETLIKTAIIAYKNGGVMPHHSHLQECFAHRVHIAVSAVNSDRADNHKAKVLLLHNLQNVTELRY